MTVWLIIHIFAPEFNTFAMDNGNQTAVLIVTDTHLVKYYKKL